MKIFLKGLLLFFIMIIAAFCQNKEAVTSIPEKSVSIFASNNSEEKKLHLKIRSYLREKGINGSVAVMKGTEVLYNEGVGNADIGREIKNTKKTTFPIASITKSMVAACILQLQEKGLLHTNDPVSKYISDLPNGKHIKIIHLLTNTSGLKPLLWTRAHSSPSDLINQIKLMPVAAFAPGTHWEYRDTNYMILGYIIEKITKMPLHTYINDNIFKKSGMRDSGFITNQEPARFSSKGYIKNHKFLRPSRKLNPALLYGAGDIYATSLDICKYDQALINGKLISKKSWNEIKTPGSVSGYGLGLYVKKDFVFSRGFISGWSSVHIIYKDRTSIVILLNKRDRDLDILKAAIDIKSIITKEEAMANNRI
ncbi:serine hydrolase domain-containing protein [Neobacillus terrae]|uniref:serine hydrolase domain-containing protein n=1 Tax=Neobacillus terrae TaxID=3034837 RepID=UPI00140E85AE|nr:serine hydrolase domain-containing protein [Neobacillus terrae]NHM31108.1 beta-lactamase family protein [Neobacillus terrae]